MAVWTTPTHVTAFDDASSAQFNEETVDDLQYLYDMLTHGAWPTYTPTLTQNGTTIPKTIHYAAYSKIGRTVIGSALMQPTGAGTTGAGVLVGLPVPGVFPGSGGCPMGSGSVYDSTAGGEFPGILIQQAASIVSIRQLHTTAIDDIGTTWPIQANDFIRVHFTYQSAA